MLKIVSKIKCHLAELLVILTIGIFSFMTIAHGLDMDMPFWQLWYLGMALGAAVFVLALVVLVQFLFQGIKQGPKHWVI